MKVPAHHQPRHARHQPRHARPRARRRTGPTVAWVAVLALAGFAFSPEPSAPAAQLADHPVVDTSAATVSMAVDEAHDPWVAAGAPAAPAQPRVGARWGTDIGWPQCGRPLPAMAVDLVVVQVTSGRPGTLSPCLAEQLAWARSVRAAVGAYVVPGSPSAADLAAADQRAACHGDRSCRFRAAGAADAAHALAGAEAAGLTTGGWWLDVEDVPERTLWGTDTDANTEVLLGWRDALRAAGKSVGVYSTRGYWRRIVGSWRANLPQWVPVGLAGVDAAGRACGRPFTSGPVLMTQWLTGPLDGNRLCRGQDRLATEFFGAFARARTAGVPSVLVTPVPHPDIEAAARAQAAREAEEARTRRAEEAAATKAARAAAAAEAAAKVKATATDGGDADPEPGSEPAAQPTVPPKDPPATDPPPAQPSPAPSPGPSAPAPTARE